MDANRDISVISHIIEYCDRINEYVKPATAKYETFKANKMLIDAVCLCVLQIGELSTILSDEIKDKNNQIPWRQIKQVRNIIAHHYGTVDAEILWEIVMTDIPDLRLQCETIIEQACECEE